MQHTQPQKITLAEWDCRYTELRAAGLSEPGYGGPLARHVDNGDLRLLKLRIDNSAASLRLWNFLLSEEDRLRRSVAAGKRLVGTMKDLGTVPVMAYSLENLVAFYPDGAWWLPCLLEGGDGLLEIADSLGIDNSFCPVRAMLGAFVAGNRFPIPGLLTCSVGATCDDFSAIAQRLESLGFPILWWEIPHRRQPDADEEGVELPGGFRRRPIRSPSSDRSSTGSVWPWSRMPSVGSATNSLPMASRANQVRRRLAELRQLCFTADPCPLPALELLIAEMLAIHFCSDQNETLAVLTELLNEVQRGRRRAWAYWRSMRCAVLGESGGRSAGDELAGGRWRPRLRDRQHVLPRAGRNPRRPAAVGGPGADGPGRSDGGLGRGPRKADLCGRPPLRRPGRRHLASPAPATARWRARSSVR